MSCVIRYDICIVKCILIFALIYPRMLTTSSYSSRILLRMLLHCLSIGGKRTAGPVRGEIGGGVGRSRLYCDYIDKYR